MRTTILAALARAGLMATQAEGQEGHRQGRDDRQLLYSDQLIYPCVGSGKFTAKRK